MQVELYADRLVVRSPGGFYGAIDPASSGAPDVSSSRNELIAKLLADTPLPDSEHMVAENRGSGIPEVMRALHRAGMAPPTFRADLRRVEMTVPQHALLTPGVLAWIGSLGADDLTDAQIQALALAHDGQEVRNQTLQGWGVHPSDATRDLTDLVQRGLLEKVGDRKWASYTLSNTLPGPSGSVPVETDPATARLTPRQETILGLFHGDLPLTAAEISQALPVAYGATIKDINHLLAAGRLEATAPPRSKRRAYRLSTRPGVSDD